MFLYLVQLLEEVDSVAEFARSAGSGFGSGQKPRKEELMILRQRVADLEGMLPSGLKSSEELHKRTWVLGKLCSQPTYDPQPGHIAPLEQVLDRIRGELRQWARQPAHYDKELLGALSNLLLRREYDSAVRKAFLVLSERLRTISGAPASIDGEDLVNHVFGQRSPLPLPDTSRVALRNFLAGAYSIFRNRFSHQDVTPTFAEADAAISAVNWALQELGKFRQ